MYPVSLSGVDLATLTIFINLNAFAYKIESELTARAVSNSMKSHAKHPFEATNA